MSDLSYEELQKAYGAAMQGSENPDAMWIRCQKCKRGFYLTKDGPNELCEHLMRVFEEVQKPHADG